MKTAFALFLIFSCTTAIAEGNLRWGEFGSYSNWERYPYEISSQYEFIGSLPDLTKFPRLLELALSPKSDDTARTIIASQLRTLSRCTFTEQDPVAKPSPETRYRQSVEQWREWWERYGSKLAADLPRIGTPRPEAWKLVAPSPYLECPPYPISIPLRWSTKIKLTTGDYGGFTEEDIEMQVDGDSVQLSRRYFTGWPGQVPWTHETWKGFDRKQADLFFAAVVYGIDNPWFFLRNEFVDEGYTENGKVVHAGAIKGRPEKWIAYYAGVHWGGFVDAEGKVIINHDPWHWDGLNIEKDEETSLGDPIGPVFRIFRDMFPDPSWDEEKSRWTPVAPSAGEKIMEQKK